MDLETLLFKAQTLTPEAYQTLCDTVCITNSKDPVGIEHSGSSYIITKTPTDKFHELVTLSCLDEKPYVRNGNVRGYQEPGAYILLFNIIAVNRNTKQIYAIYYDMACDDDWPVLLPLNIAKHVCNVVTSLMPK
jgi:hypothetical protein